MTLFPIYDKLSSSAWDVQTTLKNILPKVIGLFSTALLQTNLKFSQRHAILFPWTGILAVKIYLLSTMAFSFLWPAGFACLCVSQQNIDQQSTILKLYDIYIHSVMVMFIHVMPLISDV